MGTIVATFDKLVSPLVWGEIWGTDSGHIYATFDRLESALVDLGQPHGAVACTAVWVHEVETTRLWAGFSDGAVYFGDLDIDGQTATWTLRGTIPEGPIIEIRESYGTLNELRATAGQGYYYSADGGSSWTLFDSGDTAWRTAAGFEQNAYSFLNDDTPLRFEDGHSVTFPEIDPAVRHIRGLTFGWRTQKLYVADDQARLFISDDTFSTFTQAAVDAPSGVNHMIRSGNIDGVVYLACDDGVVKWLPDIDQIFYIKRTTNAVLMVGYGGVHLPIPHTDCIDVVVPDDPGTSLVPGFGPGTQIGRLIFGELPFVARLLTTTEITVSAEVNVTFHGSYFTAIHYDAGSTFTVADIGVRETIDGLDDAYPYTVTFCHLAPE